MSEKTMPMADNRTRQMANKDLNRLVLTEKTFETSKDKYEVDIDNRIAIGGESQVYLAKRISDAVQVIIKIYDTYTDDPQNRRNRKAILDFLNKNSEDYRKSHIMPLWDDGGIEMLDKDSGDSFTRPFDVIPYCKDGELKECDYNMLRGKVIPEILYALNLLHSNNLVHRDIKPSNIYMYNGVILLADFGTTSQIINSESHSKTQTRRGTPGYSAPEISDNYYVTASDYYSLGCTIATLFNKGRHIYQDLIDNRKFEEVNISMRREGLPLECPDGYVDLQLLVNALVMRDEKMRAGYDAVDLWVKNADSFISRWKDPAKQGYEKPRLDFNFDGIKCNTNPELTDAILNNWEKGKKFLYNGTFKNFFDKHDQTLSDKAYDITENMETAKNQDLGLSMFLHYLNTTDKPICPVYWCGDIYERLSDISAAISNGKADENKIKAMLKSKFLSWKFKNTEPVNQDTINNFSEIEEITEQYPSLAYYCLMYSCAPDKDKYNQTPDAVFNELTKNGSGWYDEARNILKDDKTFAYLVYKGYKSDILELKKNLTERFISDEGICGLLLLYKLFEGICKDKKCIREHFLKYGPLAYLYWFQQNLDLYSFNSTDARDIAKQIISIKIDVKMSINDINEGLLTLKRALKNFMPLFQNNYLLAYMGFGAYMDTAGITTNYTYAFFAGDFHGINVPVGYLKSIGM